jgi:hypothetical protein
MLRLKGFALFIGLAAVIAPSIASAQSGLVVMPIADVLRHREAAFELELTGNERNVSKGYEYANSLTMGLFDRMEVGYESDFLGAITANVKLLLFEDPHALPHCALSVGADNWRGKDVDPYAVARYDGRGYRLHGGLWRTMGSARAMLGLDCPAAIGLTASVECLCGRHGEAWTGLAYAPAFAPGFEAEIAVGIPFDHRQGVKHSLTLSYFFKL